LIHHVELTLNHCAGTTSEVIVVNRKRKFCGRSKNSILLCSHARFPVHFFVFFSFISK